MRRRIQANWVLEFIAAIMPNPEPPPDMLCLWFYRDEQERAPFVARMMDDNFPADSWRERFYCWCPCPYPPKDWAAYYNEPAEKSKK